VNLLFGVFNKDEFAALLKKAIGNRSINRFAAKCGVSPTYISKLLRNLVNNPPGVEIIKKISIEAYNVTYNELMTAAGHSMDKTEENEFIKNDSPDPREIVAAHRTDGDYKKDLPPEAVAEIEMYLDYIRHKYRKKQPDGNK
jgi:transcriptional regulator with XRE-family HTH domain